MSTCRAIIRYSFTNTAEEGSRTTALITASISAISKESALDYLTKRYPERHNMQITEVSLIEGG
jgi:hypothetical protein